MDISEIQISVDGLEGLKAAYNEISHEIKRGRQKLGKMGLAAAKLLAVIKDSDPSFGPQVGNGYQHCRLHAGSRSAVVINYLASTRDGMAPVKDICAQVYGSPSDTAKGSQVLQRLKNMGLVNNASRGMWALTEKGLAEADRLYGVNQ